MKGLDSQGKRLHQIATISHNSWKFWHIMTYLGLKSAQDKTGTGQGHLKLNSGRKVKWTQDLQTSARMLILIQFDTSVDIPSPGRSLAWRGKMNRLLLSPAPPDMREHRWAIAAMNCISLCFCDCKLQAALVVLSNAIKPLPQYQIPHSYFSQASDQERLKLGMFNLEPLQLPPRKPTHM